MRVVVHAPTVEAPDDAAPVVRAVVAAIREQVRGLGAADDETAGSGARLDGGAAGDGRPADVPGGDADVSRPGPATPPAADPRPAPAAPR